MSKKRTGWIVLVVVVIIVGVVWFAQQRKQQASEVINEGSITTLEKGTLVDSITTTGMVVSNNMHVVTLTSTYNVDEIKVKIGDVVKDGDVLATLDVSERNAMIPEIDGDDVITANGDGTVTEINVQEGMPVSGVAFSIQELDDLYISTSVKERDIITVKPDMAVEITPTAVTGFQYIGEIESIAPVGTISAVGTLFSTTVQVENEDENLKVGMNVKVRYILSSVDNVLNVPYDSVYMENGTSYVLVATKQDDDTFKLMKHEVTTGSSNDVNIEISGDVEVGDQIINYPSNYIDDLEASYMIEEGNADE